VLKTSRIGLLALALASACSDARQPPEAGAPQGSNNASSSVTARGVELRVPQPGGGDVVIAGDAFALGPDRNASLTGGVRLWSEGGMRFEASAARAALTDGGRVAVLEGGVRAVLAIGHAAGDAGAADD
jgi:hypothetical protein